MTEQEVLLACINKELAPYGVTCEDVIKGADKEFHYVGTIEKKKILWFFKKEVTSYKKIPWYQFYTFNSKEEYETWEKFCITLMRKELKQTKNQAEKKFRWLDLTYGLKQNYER